MFYPKTDLHRLASSLDCDLDEALGKLKKLYAWVDERNSVNTADLDLPCGQGCDGCCHESVFLTPLEFIAAWKQLQEKVDDEQRSAIVAQGLRLFQENRRLIESFEQPPAPGQTDHFSGAEQLKFRCPLLDEQGGCLVYDSRELYARLFGSAFNSEGGVYGCHLVGQHLAGKVVTLVRAKQTAKLLAALPLTFKRQVYPYYIDLLYGD